MRPLRLAAVKNLDQDAAPTLTPSASHPFRGFEIVNHRGHRSGVTSEHGSQLDRRHILEMSASARAA